MQSINSKLTDVYKALDAKLNRLARTPTGTNNNEHKFFQRVINLTNIVFTDEERVLLNKGMKYNLNHKHNRDAFPQVQD